MPATPTAIDSAVRIAGETGRLATAAFFFDFKLPLAAIGRLVCYFDAHLLVHQVENLTEISRKTISKFYARLRVRMRD